MPNIKFNIFTNKVYRVIDDACLRQLKGEKKNKNSNHAKNIPLIYKYLPTINNEQEKDDELKPLLKECFFTRQSSPTSLPRHSLIIAG
ncbi:hypothetical protein D917_08683 [Trichinella nativa]|uniref:Uncharacterized protein n=1 Tax=Trichinella nativa TaxID=6335 RepID=A0A1Y3EIY6_9BILA|nr:hypothetical protein D917_08683 [Trichinella nativa]